ncbi:hypothetical protein HanPSC8_Chr09g0374331 [Helianthus annuus]|nr:hypothetical protein HanPSC8_Chr09g0374331 [Helianthus annuus]
MLLTSLLAVELLWKKDLSESCDDWLFFNFFFIFVRLRIGLLTRSSWFCTLISSSREATDCSSTLVSSVDLLLDNIDTA